MFKYAIACLVALCSFTSINYDTDPELESFLKEFVKDKECTKMSFSGNLFSFKNSENVESEVETFQLYIFSDEHPLSSGDQNLLSQKVQASNLELLNMIKSDGNNIEIFVKDNDDVIENIVLLVFSEDSSIILHAKGKIRYSDLKNLNIDVEGLDDVLDDY